MDKKKMKILSLNQYIEYTHLKFCLVERIIFPGFKGVIKQGYYNPY